MGEFADEAIDRAYEDFPETTERYPIWKGKPLECLETTHLINIRKCIRQERINLGTDNDFFVSCIEEILDNRGVYLIPVKKL